MQVQRLDHVSINVVDRARSIAWYRDVLDMAKERLDAHGVSYRSADHGNALSVYFRDPDGNTLELTTYKR